MIKTTTLPQNTSRKKIKEIKKVSILSDDFGPSDFTIQNILNYSKSLQVIALAGAETAFAVMN